ncbi:hypothetical protein PMAYCL1PPCAC_24475, partial [Pristionchus mayeri]
ATTDAIDDVVRICTGYFLLIVGWAEYIGISINFLIIRVHPCSCFVVACYGLDRFRFLINFLGHQCACTAQARCSLVRWDTLCVRRAHVLQRVLHVTVN